MKNVKLPFAFPIIYLITGGMATPENFPETSARILNLVCVAARSGVPLVQIREKNLPARLVFELTRKAVAVAGSETKILVNDRADVALAAGAHGVHLTAQSLPIAIVRKSFPRDFIVGVSAHALEEIAAARDEGADFAAFSPIFATPSKAAFDAPQGLEKLRIVCEKLKPFPIVALGGIDENNYEPVLESGASGLAAIRFLNDAATLPKTVEAINSYGDRRK